jgi:hypothetical protein
MENDLLKVCQRLDVLERRMDNVERILAVHDRNPMEKTGEKRLSLREFLLSKKPTDDVKRTLVLGYYLEKLEGLISFNASDLEKAFERAKEKKPPNINDKVSMNIKNGHIDEAKGKKDKRKAWFLTNSGEQYVESNFKQEK